MIHQEIQIPRNKKHKDLISYLKDSVAQQIDPNEYPVRFAITKTDKDYYYCELGSLLNLPESSQGQFESVFRFRSRKFESTSDFNVALLVPTGIGSEIGGHAGDAGPVSKLFASVCDNLITHPNVVNASDINEMTENTLYVEGSILTRLLMGTVGLQKVRNNRIIFIIDDHEKEVFVNGAINSVNAARATFGLDCPEVIRLNPPIEMRAEFSEAHTAVGDIVGMENLFDLLDKRKRDYDAIALSSVIHVPFEWHAKYFEKQGEMINPWGGVEAMLTHAISHLYNVPSAHSPMFETEQIANMDPGVVDPRMAAEAVSLSFLQCIFKGLQRSPKIITDQTSFFNKDIISAEDITCLIIPDKCIGLPTLAALEQGIPVIAVRDNINIMDNDLSQLPWKHNQLHYVNSYLEAVGVLAAIKAGITIESVRRPLLSSRVSRVQYKDFLREFDKDSKAVKSSSDT